VEFRSSVYLWFDIDHFCVGTWVFWWGRGWGALGRGVVLVYFCGVDGFDFRGAGGVLWWFLSLMIL